MNKADKLKYGYIKKSQMYKKYLPFMKYLIEFHTEKCSSFDWDDCIEGFNKYIKEFDPKNSITICHRDIYMLVVRGLLGKTFDPKERYTYNLRWDVPREYTGRFHLYITGKGKEVTGSYEYTNLTTGEKYWTLKREYVFYSEQYDSIIISEDRDYSFDTIYLGVA